MGELDDEAIRSRATKALDDALKYSKKENFDRALEASLTAKGLFEDLDDIEGQAEALMAVARVANSRGDVEEAIRLATEAREFCRDIDETTEAASLLLLGQTYVHGIEKLMESGADGPLLDGTASAALQAAGPALKVYRSMVGSVVGDLGQANALYIIAHANMALKHNDTAIRFGMQSYTLFKGLKDYGMAGNAMYVISEAHRQNGKLEDAHRAVKEALVCCVKGGNEQGAHNAANLCEMYYRASLPETDDSDIPQQQQQQQADQNVELKLVPTQPYNASSTSAEQMASAAVVPTQRRIMTGGYNAGDKASEQPAAILVGAPDSVQQTQKRSQGPDYDWELSPYSRAIAYCVKTPVMNY